VAELARLAAKVGELTEELDEASMIDGSYRTQLRRLELVGHGLERSRARWARHVKVFTQLRERELRRERFAR
jgi:hypothetical protein